MPRGAPRPGLVVSLTSHGARVDRVWITVASLLRQSLVAERIVLWLAREEFPGGLRLPPRLRALEGPRFEVRWTAKDTRSYKKLLPALDAFPGAVLVTADDDVVYPRHWLRDLVTAHEREPLMVVGHRGYAVPVHDGRVAPYRSWPHATTSTPAARTFLTGVGGILYPPGSLDARVTDLATAMRLCPTADDVWFKAMSLLNGRGCRVVTDGFPDLAPTARRGPSLLSVNVGEGRNDEQIAALLGHFGPLPCAGVDRERGSRP